MNAISNSKAAMTEPVDAAIPNLLFWDENLWKLL